MKKAPPLILENLILEGAIYHIEISKIQITFSVIRGDR